MEPMFVLCHVDEQPTVVGVIAMLNVPVPFARRVPTGQFEVPAWL